MTKKLEINFTKKPEIVFQFDQFLNVEQAVDKFLNKKENLKKLIAPLIPTNLEETIQKLIPEVSDGYTPQKGVDYDDGKDGETPSDEKIISLIEPRIQKAKDGTTPKKGIDYFTKQELNEIKKELKTTILSEMPEHATKQEVNIKITEVLEKIRKLPTGGGGAQFLRQLMDVNVGNPTAQQYGLTYNPSRGEFALTAITGGGGGAVDSVNGQTGVVVLDADDIDETASRIWFTTAEETKLAGIETGAEVNTIDTVSDTSEIDLTITARALSASIVAGSIDETKLDTSVNASLDLADSSVQNLGDLGITASAAELNVLDGITASTTELNYTDGVTSAIQTQLDGKQASLGFIAENVANKATDFTTVNDTLYPTVQAVKTYADAIAQGLSVKESVRVSTATALPTNTYSNGASGVGATLTGVATGVLTVDGVAMALNDRILVKDEVATANNGIYYVSVAGAIGVAYILTRSLNMDTTGEFSGAFCFTEEGTVNSEAGFVCTSNDPITVGTTSITFTQFSGAGQITAGDGLAKTGNTLSVNVDNSSIEISGDNLRVKAAGVTEAMLNASTNTSLDLADSALQPADIASGTITARADDINFSGGVDGDVLTVQADGSLALEAGGGGTPTAITVANEATDATCFPSFFTAATGDLGPKTNAGLTFNSATATLGATAFSGPLTGNVTGNVSGTAATVTTAAQPAITSVGTLTALDVDNININGNTITATGDLNLTPTAGNQVVLDGTIEVDAGVVTGATSISSTAFVGALTGNASTATALQTGRTIGGVSFDGTANIVPQTIQSINEATDTTCFPLFISASGSQSLQPLNNTSLTFNSSTANFGSTLFNAGTGYQIGGAAASNKILKGNGTNFVASTETYAAPGTTGNVMTSDGTNWTSAAPAAASLVPYYQANTDFGSTSRFNQATSGTGALTFGTFGVRVSTGATANSYADCQWFVVPAVQGLIFNGSPEFSCSISLRNIPTGAPNTGTVYIGIGLLSYTGTSIDFTGKHIGFKLVVTGADTSSLYATQGSGGTETVSAALTTVQDSPDSLDLCFKVNNLTSVDYYWRKNGGSWSSATNLSTNLPTTGDTGRVAQFLAINQNTANNNEVDFSNASYKR